MTELDKYKLAYNSFMDYFNELSEESKRELDLKLNELGL